MVQALTGLRGFVNPDPEATAAQVQGDYADPRHGVPGEKASPYPWEAFPGAGLPHGPYGIDNDILGWGQDWLSTSEPAGYLEQDPTADLQPVTRAAPWPKGVPTQVDADGTQAWRDQEAAIHGMAMGGSREMLFTPTADPVQDDWVEFADVDPGESNQVEIPNQIKGATGGWGSTDRVQSFALQNQYGFDSAHMHRRVAEGSIPGNYMWMEPGGRPLIKSVAGTAVIPIGVDSPYAGQDVQLPYDPRGAVLMTLPAQYEAPPDPALASGYPALQPDSGVPLW